jgi:hypothetical protein
MMFLLVGVLGMVVTFALLIPIFIVLAVTMQKSLNGPHPPTLFIVLLETANLAVSFLVRAFVMPIYVTSLLLFYYDQRTRQEGYDIEQLMMHAGWSELSIPAAVSVVPATANDRAEHSSYSSQQPSVSEMTNPPETGSQFHPSSVVISSSEGTDA